MNTTRTLEKMSETIPRKQCPVCQETIDVEDGEEMQSVDVPHFFKKQIEESNPPLAKHIDRNDGRVIYHVDCTHPIEEYTSVSEEVLDETREKYDVGEIETVDCPVCHNLVVSDRDECPRCGKELG